MAVPMSAVPIRRLAKFGMVGVSCLLIQYCAMLILKHFGVLPLLADSLSFFLSAQVNYWLSQKFTWHDGRAVGSRKFWQLLRFNAVAIAVSVANGQLYELLSTTARLHGVVALLCTNIVCAALTFLLNHWLVFRLVRPLQNPAPVSQPEGADHAASAAS